MQGRTNAGGTGGFGLSLKIVNGATMPSNPRENTIWIKTSVKIASYAIQSEAPESPTEGLLWLKNTAAVAVSEGVDISIGKKDTLTLHLADAKLYTGGAWANVEGWVYAGGSWTQFAYERLYLFKYGIDNTELTGGWTGNGWSRGGYKVGVVTNDGAKLIISKKANVDGYVVGGTNNAVNLNGFKTINAIATGNNSSGNSEFCISRSKTVDQKSWVAGISKTAFNAEDVLLSFPLDNPGECYVGFGRITYVKVVYLE